MNHHFVGVVEPDATCRGVAGGIEGVGEKGKGAESEKQRGGRWGLGDREDSERVEEDEETCAEEADGGRIWFGRRRRKVVNTEVGRISDKVKGLQG
jgi:hypothetical protein